MHKYANSHYHDVIDSDVTTGSDVIGSDVITGSDVIHIDVTTGSDGSGRLFSQPV